MSGKGQLRPASIDDASAISAFLISLGLVMPAGEEATRAHWQGLWENNPALAHHKKPALGWVLEDDGAIKGFFGNIPQVSWMGETPVTVSSARAWAVDPEYRTETPRLCAAFFEQPDVDLVLISSANPPAGKRCLAFGGAKMPQPEYDNILYWVVNASGFLSAAFRKKGRGSFAASMLGLLGSVPLDFNINIKGRRPYGGLDHLTPVSLDGVDAAFDDLWHRKRAQMPDTLLASRDAETLKWYFGLGAGRDNVRFLRYDKDGALKGYAVLVREDAPAIGLKRLKVADIFADNDDPDVLQALLAGAYDYARARQCHVLELIGLPKGAREVAQKSKPFSRPMATFPFFYKTLNAGLEEKLSDASAWYVTAYDGDTSLI